MKRFDDFFTEAQQYSTILKNYKENGEVFNDPNFSPNFDITDSNIKINQNNIIWRRIDDFYKAPLFQKDLINEYYIDEGELNESSLIAALARTAKQPELIKKLFDTSLITENDNSIDLRCGAVVILLHAFNQQTPILIDTQIPFINGTRKPLFIRPTSLKCSIWFCLVEKAIAKLLGGYSAISNISLGQSCYILFGCQPQKLTVGMSSSEKSENESNGENFTFNGFVSIVEWLEKGAVVSASIGSSNSQSASEKGLVPCESYLVCSANSVDSRNFVVLRSPKNSIEWLGDWSNTSNDLTLEMRKKVGLKSDVIDGTFCMIEEDFLSYFSNFELAIPVSDSMHSKSFVAKIEGDNSSMQTFAFKLKENENDDVDVVVTVEKWTQNSGTSTFSEEEQDENESTVEAIVVFNGSEKISQENMSLDNCKKFTSNEKVFGFSLHLTDKSPFSIAFNHSTGPSQNEEIYATVNCVSDFDIYNIEASDQLSPENEKIGASFTNDLNEPNNETENESSIATIVENQLSSFANLESQMESNKTIDDEEFNESLQKLIELSKNSNLRLDEKVPLFFQSVRSIVSSSIPTQPSNTQKNINDSSNSLPEHREVVEKYFGLLDEMQRTLPNLLYMSLSKLEEFDGFTQKVCEQLKIDPNESSYETILTALQKRLCNNGENIDLGDNNGSHEESQPDQQLNDDMNFFNDSFENLNSEKQNEQLIIDQMNEEEEIFIIESTSLENSAENSKEEKDDRIAVNNEDQVFLTEEEESKSDNNHNQITSESEFGQIDIQIPDMQSVSENQQADQPNNIINNDDQNLNQDASEKLDHFTESQNESPRDALDASSELKVETEESKTESQKQADSEFAFEIEEEEEEDHQVDHPTENDGEIVFIEKTLEVKLKLESGAESDSSPKEYPIILEPPNPSDVESTSKDEIVFKLLEENQAEIDVEFEGEIHSESEKEKSETEKEKEKENENKEETEKEEDSHTQTQDESQRNINNKSQENSSQQNNDESVSHEEDAMILSQSSEPPPTSNIEHKSDSESVSRKQKQPQTKTANKASTKPSTAKKPPQRSKPKKRAAAPPPQATQSQPKKNQPPLEDSEAASQSSVPPVQTTDSSSSRRRASSAANRKPKSSSQIVSAKNGSKVAGFDDNCVSNANLNTSAASQPHTSIYPRVVQDSSSTSSAKRRCVRKAKEEINKNNNNNNSLEGGEEQCKMKQNSESESEIGTGKYWKVQQTEDPEKPFLLSKEMPSDKKSQQRKPPTRRSASATNNKKQSAPATNTTTTPSKAKPVRRQSASKAKLEVSPLCVSESESPQKQEEKQSTVEVKITDNQPAENESAPTKNEQHQNRSSSSKRTSKSKPDQNVQKSNKEKLTTQKTEQTPVDSETKKAQKKDHDDTHKKRKHNHTEKVTERKHSHTQNSEKKKKTQKQPASESETSKRRARSVQCRDSRNHNNTEDKTVKKPSTNAHVSFESPLLRHQRQPPSSSSTTTTTTSYSSNLDQNNLDFESCECLGFCGSYQKLLRKRRQDRILYDELNEENFFVDRSDRYWDPKLAYEREYFNLKTGGNFTCPKVANYCNRRRNPSCSTRSRPDLSAFVNYFELEGTQLNCSYLPKRLNKY